MRSSAQALVALTMLACGREPAPPKPIAPPPSTASRSTSSGEEPDGAAVGPRGRDADVPDAAGEPTAEVEEVWAPDRSLYVTLVESRVHVWDGHTRAQVAELDDSGCEDPTFSPDSKTIYVGHTNRPPTAFDVATKFARPRSFELPKPISPNGDAGVGKLSVSRDGRWLLGRCNTVSVCLWNTKTQAGRTWAPPPGPAFADMKTLAFGERGDRIGVTMEDGASFELEVPSLKRLTPNR